MNQINLDNELICCQICSIKYSLHHNVPWTLNCGHSYCKPCLEKIKKDSSIICPIDKKKIPIYVGVNENKSICKNIDLIKFLMLLKLFKKIDLSIFQTFSFEFCDDCNVFFLSSLRDKHLFRSHKLLNLEQFNSKYVMNSEEKRKFYILMRFFYMHDYSLLNPKNYLDIEEIFINEYYYFLTFNINVRMKKILELFEEIKIKSDNKIKYGYLFKDKNIILGFFELDVNNKIITVFGISLKKSKNKQKKYFFGFMNFKHHDNAIVFNIGIYIDNLKLMIGKFFTEDNTHLLYGDILNLGINDTDQLIPLNFANEHNYQFLFNKIQSVHKIYNDDNSNLIEESYNINFTFNTCKLKEILIERISLTIETHSRIDIPEGDIKNYKLADVSIHLFFFGKNKLEFRIISKTDFIIVFSSNYGLRVKINECQDSEFSQKLDIIKEIPLQQFNDNFSKFVIGISKILNEKLTSNFQICYKYFKNIYDLEVDVSKENFYFDLMRNTVKTNELSSEYIINYSLNCKTISELINEIQREINAVSNILHKEKTKMNGPKDNNMIAMHKNIEKKKKEKIKINCKCIFI